MDSEIETHHQEQHAAVAAIARLAGGLPAFGIVAAVLGWSTRWARSASRRRCWAA